MTMHDVSSLDPSNDAAWAEYKSHWEIRPDTIYLNHGSFGPPPRCVQQERDRWQREMECQPMDFFVRQFEPAWLAARQRLAEFVGASPGNLIFVENATVGMNIVADSFPLAANDEVLLTNHEYGAVERIWKRACAKAEATLKTAMLPLPFHTAEETTAAILAAATTRTKLLVVSHITSPTAVTLPVNNICAEARRRGIAIAIDGPHAIAQLPLQIDALDCDFYAASCHKWLSAPFGSGFLYAGPRQQAHVRPPVLSWGRLPPHAIESWSDEFLWSGTRNPAAFLAIPAAIDFLDKIGLDRARARMHWLARIAREKLVALTRRTPLVPDDPAWYASMAHVPLPPPTRASETPSAPQRSDAVSNPLQRLLWQQFGIEVPVVSFGGERFIRVSCHLYNDVSQIDRLVAALKSLLLAGE